MVGDNYFLLTKMEDAPRRILCEVADGAVHGLVADNGRRFLVAERDRLPGHLGLLALNERSLLAG